MKHVKRYLGFILLSLLISKVSSAQVVTGPVKWHPGHYYTIKNAGIVRGTESDYRWYMDQVYAELKSTPVLRGLQIRLFWSDIETAEGVYDFRLIDRMLGELAHLNKRLVIQIQTRSFEMHRQPAPNYLKTAPYEFGQYQYSRYGAKTPVPIGYNVKLWNANVRGRLVALFNVLGKRYNLIPNFEGIGMIETALGIPYNPTTKKTYSLTLKQENDFFTNLMFVHTKAREFFPNTINIQEINQPKARLPYLASSLFNMGGMISGPDTFLQEEELIQTAYKYYRQYAGQIPVGPQVMESNYMYSKNTKNDGTGFVPTIAQLFNFARDYLKSNYIFWGRDAAFVPKLLAELKTFPVASLPEGDLAIACPTQFLACIDNLTGLDLIAPTLNISAPQNNAKIRSKIVKNYQIKATGSDNMLVLGFKLYIDGKLVQTFGGSTLNYVWNVRPLAYRDYEIKIEVLDHYGKSAALLRKVTLTP